MAGPESKLYSKLKRINSAVYLHRVENTLSVGTPDVYFVAPDIGAGWLELKVSSGKRKLILRYPPHQRVWARKHHMAGGLHYLVALHNDECLWWKGSDAVNPTLDNIHHTGFDFQ